jgi:2',3'-cyclic-nucleotide 2'-phosphodiesterase (5'-nucleotidase family)
VLDAGNSLTGDRPPANTTQGATSVEAMNMMGYDAMTLGAGDLRLGLPALTARMHEAKFAFVSANAVVSDTGALVAPAFIVREVDGRRIAVVGLTGAWDQAPLPDTRILDPVEAARTVVPEAAAQADLVILLSDAGNPTDLTIADSVPGISFIVSGGPFQSFGQSQLSPETATLLAHADYPASGHAGRTVGKAVLGFDASGQPESYTWTPITLNPDTPDDPDMAAWRAKQ